MSLQYLGKHKPHKLGIFRHAVYCVSKNDSALLCYMWGWGLWAENAGVEKAGINHMECQPEIILRSFKLLH